MRKAKNDRLSPRVLAARLDRALQMLGEVDDGLCDRHGDLLPGTWGRAGLLLAVRVLRQAAEEVNQVRAALESKK